MGQRLRQIEFTADFPDDIIWDEAGETVLRTNGLNVASTVADILRATGMEVKAPEEHHEHGWDFLVQWGDDRFWVQVTVLDAGEAHILTADQSGLLRRIMLRKSRYPAFLGHLHRALSADERFLDLRWHPYISDPNLAGALSPSSPYPGPKVKKRRRRRKTKASGVHSLDQSGAATLLTHQGAREPTVWTDLPLGPVGSFFASIHTVTTCLAAGVIGLVVNAGLIALGLPFWAWLLLGVPLSLLVIIFALSYFDYWLFQYLKRKAQK